MRPQNFSGAVDVHGIFLGYGPFPLTVTTRILPFLVGNPYKPLFATVTGKGPHPRYSVVKFVKPFKHTLSFLGLRKHDKK